MKNWLAQNSSRTAKILTILCLAFVICYIVVIMNDINLYHQQLGAVLSASDPGELQAMSSAFVSIAAYRCPMILAPAAGFGAAALLMHGIKTLMAKPAETVQPVQA